jgi:hypothetical protein
MVRPATQRIGCSEFAFQVQYMAPAAAKVINAFDPGTNHPIDAFVPATDTFVPDAVADNESDDLAKLPIPAHIAEGYEGDMRDLHRVVHLMRLKIQKDKFYMERIDVVSLEGDGPSVGMIHWMADVMKSARIRWAPITAIRWALGGHFKSALQVLTPQKFVEFGRREIDKLEVQEPGMKSVFRLRKAYHTLHMNPDIFVSNMMYLHLGLSEF